MFYIYSRQHNNNNYRYPDHIQSTDTKNTNTFIQISFFFTNFFFSFLVVGGLNDYRIKPLLSMLLTKKQTKSKSHKNSKKKYLFRLIGEGLSQISTRSTSEVSLVCDLVWLGGGTVLVRKGPRQSSRTSTTVDTVVDLTFVLSISTTVDG